MIDPTDNVAVERAADEEHLRALDDHHTRETIADLREKALQTYVNILLQPGQSCYPWTVEHLEEAVTNGDEGQRKFAAACLFEAVDAETTNDHKNAVAVLAMKHLVEEYWKDVADYMARKNESWYSISEQE